MPWFSKNDTAVTKVTALTEPYAAAMAPAFGTPIFFFKAKNVYTGTMLESITAKIME